MIEINPIVKETIPIIRGNNNKLFVTEKG